MIPKYRLVEYLVGASLRGDGATLGALRRGWAQPLALYPIIAPFLPLPPTQRTEDVSLLVARLFGRYPKLGHLPFAIALREAALRRSGGTIEKRLTAILAAPFADLPEHLRNTISLLAAEGLSLDWYRLMDDLLRWDADGQPVQRAWARAYWSTDERPSPQQTPEKSEPTKETV